MDFFDFYLRYEYGFAATQLSLAMLGMGATLTPRDFVQVFLAPKALSIGLTLQMMVVPLVALAFIHAMPLDPGLAVGLALCAAIPGGTISNIFTYLANGHIALSIALTAVATIACLVTTPIVLGLLITEYMPAGFVMPAGQIAMEIAIFLLLPLLLGMGVLKYLPGQAERISKWGIRGSLFVIALIVIGAAGAGRLDVEAFGLPNMGIVLLFIIVLTVVAGLIPMWLRFSMRDVAAINIEIAVRNTNLGLLIKASLFPAVVGKEDPVGDFVLFTVLLYGALQLLVGAALITRYRKRIASSQTG